MPGPTRVGASSTSDAFAALGAVKAPLSAAARVLAARLARRADTWRRSEFQPGQLKVTPSALLTTTRHWLGEVGDWTVLLSDCRSPTSLAYALGKKLKTERVVLKTGDHSFWHHATGREQRTVYALRESTGWVFHQEGPPRDYEDLAAYRLDSPRDRLTDSSVQRYFTAVTGLAWPLDWPTVLSVQFERAE